MRFAVVILFLAVGVPVKAQQQRTISLSCDGTSRLTAPDAADINPDPIKERGIVVSLSNRTVSFGGFALPITNATATQIDFAYREATAHGPITIGGEIDRMNGTANIRWNFAKPEDELLWHLKCRVKAPAF